VGYYDARSLDYISSGFLPLLEWLRLPGDAVFIIGGVLPLVYLSSVGAWYALQRITDGSQASLFTEITIPAPDSAPAADPR
jgi:nitric oxide reductase subunit B